MDIAGDRGEVGDDVAGLGDGGELFNGARSDSAGLDNPGHNDDRCNCGDNAGDRIALGDIANDRRGEVGDGVPGLEDRCDLGNSGTSSRISVISSSLIQ